jgi:hypothetical protein
MNHETIDLTTSGGGDLLVINKLPVGINPQYEVTVLATSAPTHSVFFALCNQVTQGKQWGLA